MPMDKQDYDMVKSLRDAVRSGDDITHNLLRQLNQRQEKSDAQMVTAFNNVATALRELGDEIKGLRRDLAPELDKPKLSQPKRGPK
ncbi:MAG TPA: hypothetical protein VEF76_09925 [Patescibacteria group bacterium]|nr:hypothetical protein [Patescibacteria group bacterium]